MEMNIARPVNRYGSLQAQNGQTGTENTSFINVVAGKVVFSSWRAKVPLLLLLHLSPAFESMLDKKRMIKQVT